VACGAVAVARARARCACASHERRASAASPGRRTGSVHDPRRVRQMREQSTRNQNEHHPKHAHGERVRGAEAVQRLEQGRHACSTSAAVALLVQRYSGVQTPGAARGRGNQAARLRQNRRRAGQEGPAAGPGSGGRRPRDARAVVIEERERARQDRGEDHAQQRRDDTESIAMPMRADRRGDDGHGCCGRSAQSATRPPPCRTP